MTYAISQDERYLGNERWSWSVWLDATPQELDQVRMVTWILHPTFSPSRIPVRDRSKSFRLDAGGWGTFLLHAELRIKGQKDPLKLSHMLKLSTPESVQVVAQEGPDEPAASAAPQVFLSYSSEDAETVRQFLNAALERGLKVTDANTLPAGVPMDAAIRKAIRESDAVVSFSGGDYLSPWVAKEAQLAKLEGTPVFTVSTEVGGMPSLSVSQSSAVAQSVSGELQAELSTLLDKFSTRSF